MYTNSKEIRIGCPPAICSRCCLPSAWLDNLCGKKDFAFSESRHVASEPREWASKKPRGGTAFVSQQPCKNFGEGKFVDPAIDEGRRQFRRVCQHDRATPHQITR